MSDGSFQEAYARVRSRYDDQAWIALTPRQVTEAIYQELRLLDATRNRMGASNATAADPKLSH
jgi:hypothetical protein